MKTLSLLLASLLCLTAAFAGADDHDHDDDGPRETEVIRGGPSGGGGGPGRRMREDDEDDDGPRGVRRERAMAHKGRHGGDFEPDPAMKEKREALRKATDKVRDAAKKLRGAKDSEKAALKKEARVALAELFDARLAMEQGMLDKMSEHLAEKKEKLAKKKAAKDKLVDERLGQLTGDVPSWDD